jgi:large subunit ribosomal protein L7/L12
MEDTTTTAAAAETKEVAVPAKFKKIVEEIETMSVLELNELVKVFEEKFGVSATAVAAVAGPAAGGADAAEEKTSASVELTDAGANKIAVIKIVKEVLGLGLKEAKDLVDGAPSMLKADLKMEEANELKKKIEEAGGKATLK